MTQSSDDKEKQRQETHDLAAEMFKDIFPIVKPSGQEPHHVQVRKAANKIVNHVHVLACQLITSGGSSNEEAARDYIFQQFYAQFQNWSKDDLLFLILVQHTIMECENVGIAAFPTPKIMKP